MGVVGVSRFDVVLVRLDPTRGSEMRKTRPCVVVSPDEMNQALRTVVVAPMTTQGHAYPWRVPVAFGGQAGRIALDQIRTVDRERLARRVGHLDAGTALKVLDTLAEMFAP
ncbi:MAG: type II toxin-antitoxin system PemK/MazF family toxin [Chloroflexi bacterium]|nr:type II toxin-antitoxin system PemK/MazF family toxin [Chloroflexota bacterium]